MEETAADKKDRPVHEIRLLKAVVFTNPLEEAEDLLVAYIEGRKSVLCSHLQSLSKTME
jgi:hypothetical protein